MRILVQDKGFLMTQIWHMRQGSKVVTRIAAMASAALLVNGTLIHPSAAQITALPQPEFTVKDENGVDLLSANVYLEVTDLTIGAKEHPLTHTAFSEPDGNWVAKLSPSTGGIVEDDFDYSFVEWTPKVNRSNCVHDEDKNFIGVHFMHTTETFRGCLVYTPVRATGSTLTYNSNNTYNYTMRDGTVIVLGAGYLGGDGAGSGTAMQATYPDGRVLTLGYCADGPGASWLCSATRSDGLQLKYNYAKNSAGAWQMTGVTAINNAYEYCNPTATICSLKMVWPSATYTMSAVGATFVFTVTDAAGRVTRYTDDATARIIGVKLPSSATTNNITYTYCNTNCPQYPVNGPAGPVYQDYVLNVVRDGYTWSYSGSMGSPTATQCGPIELGAAGIETYGFTNPVGSGKQVSVNNCSLPLSPGPLIPGTNPLIQLTDEEGEQFNIWQSTDAGTGNAPGLPKSLVKLEGNQTGYQWDSRGNLTQETETPKPGSPLSQVTLAANYDSTCTIQVKCNQPNWVKDGLQNETDYTYDPIHGGVLTRQLPADPNGIRPQTTYTYSQRYAWVLNASGAYVQSAAPIWVLTTETICRTSAATSSGCAVAGDQVVKTYQYGPNSGPNNLFLRGVSVAADGVTETTCYGYDPRGNKISETEPAAGLTTCP